MTTLTVKPTKPWAATPADRIRDLSILLGSILASYLMVAVTPMKGKLAYFFTFFFFYMIATAGYKLVTRGQMAAKDALVSSIVAIGAVSTLIPIVSILATVISKGIKGLHWSLFTTDMSLATPTDAIAVGGLLHAITGTLTMVALSLVISVPIGILTALYMTEIKGRLIGPIRFLVQAMSGVPSIVAGLFILSSVLYPITKAYSGFMGVLAL
ncbi:MAG: phosphate ABC transporter, permease protein PstA, partial [Actinobacteria bacterium]|nr:phosphate ABC transporter, permease protein PstA [Actinomycetota bacterium]